MAYQARVEQDSVNQNGERLTTFVSEFPRFVLAEFNTHRMFSRNSASSRAIPVEKQLRKVLDDPFIPIYWGINQPGMQAQAELNLEEMDHAEDIWLRQRDYAVVGAVALTGGVEKLKDESLQARIEELQKELGADIETMPVPVHKQTANRLLEPFMWHTVIVTATEWSNFYALRDNEMAQPEIQRIAHMMREAHLDSTPTKLDSDEWHMPLIQPDEQGLPLEMLKKISVGRVARVSYLTHDGVRDHDKDLALHDSLLSSGHMSPFEHVATPLSTTERVYGPQKGNFKGWKQYRSEIPGEDDFSKIAVEA